MKKELENDGAVPFEVPFKAVDIFVPFLPESSAGLCRKFLLFEELGMNAQHEKSILIGGPEKFLGISDTLQISLDDFLGLPFQLVTSQLPHMLGARPGGIPIAQSHFVPRLDSKKMT